MPGLLLLVGCVTVVGVVLGQAAAGVRRLLLAWPAVHLLVLGTGGLASPLLPLAAAWVAALGASAHRRGWAAAGAAGAAVALLATTWLLGTVGSAGDVAQMLLLFALAAVLPRLLSRRTSVDAGPATAAPGAAPDGVQPGGGSAPDSAVLADALEIARCATGADEAVLWVMEETSAAAGGPGVLRRARAAAPEVLEAEERIELAGHPYGWAMLEQVRVHLESGRRPLPRDWAREMLLVPLDGGQALLALAFRETVDPEAAEIALRSARLLDELRRLLHDRAASRRDGSRIEALAEAVQALPAELQLDRFASSFAATLLQASGAHGVALALWDAEAATGRLLHSHGLAATRTEIEIRETDSRLALACKHGTALHYADLAREPRRLPLCFAGEQWEHAPRSAVVQPIQLEGHTIAAAAVWHDEPHAFGEREAASLQTLCSLAAPSLQNALHYDALDRRAAADPLTGLPNRRAFDARYAAVSAHFQRYGRPFGVILLDVDHFKQFNDTWGHEAGDRVLQQVAGLLRASVREVDLAARIGGEEFVIVLPETSLAQALTVAERVRAAIAAHPVPWNGRLLGVTASLGVAACPESSAVASEALAAADAALYLAKAAGRDRVLPAPAAPHPDTRDRPAVDG